MLKTFSLLVVILWSMSCLSVDLHVITDEKFIEKLLKFMNDRDFDPKVEELNCEIVHEGYSSLSNTSNYGYYKKYAVAADTEQCSPIGKEILRMNGSAVDAAIAVTLCNGVINSHSSGIGGGSFMMIYLKDKKKIYAIDARERAPYSSDTFMYLNSTLSSTRGGSATGIPGELMGLYEAYQLGGKLPWRELFLPSIRLCMEGFFVTTALENALKQYEKRVRENPEMSSIFINPLTDSLPKKGDLIKRVKLGHTLDVISKEGVNSFYNGTLTKLIVSEINENGGDVKLKDLHDYKAHVKEPIQFKLGNKNRAFLPPPPSGGLITGFIVKLMSGFNFSSIKDQNERDVIFYHRLVESFKHAYAYRAILGDEDFIDLTEIVHSLSNDETFINKIRKKIIDYKTFTASFYGNATFKSDHGTSHASILAPNGDAVAITTSVNTYFGAFYMGKHTGIVYNNQMDDFSTPGITNYYNIKPSESNKILPGKRPQSSMSPMIILDDANNVRLVIGASGGSKIISGVAQVVIKNLFMNRKINEAIDDKRVHDQLYPETVDLEEGFNQKIQQVLQKIGNKVSCYSFGGSVIQAISKIDNNILAVSDARKGGKPDGE